MEERVLAEKIEVTPTTTSTPTETSNPTPEPTEIPEPSEEPTPIPTQTPKPTQTSTPLPQSTFSASDINGFIERFAAQYGVDPNVLRHIAICESGFNPLSINGPYQGLYQFASSTWSNYRRKMGEEENPDLRLNAEEAIQSAAYVANYI